MKIEIEVNSDEADELVRLSLISSYENALEFDTEEVHNAYKIVIKQYSDPDQWKEFYDENNLTQVYSIGE